MPRSQHILGHPTLQPGLASLFVKKIGMASLFVKKFGMASLFVKNPKNKVRSEGIAMAQGISFPMYSWRTCFALGYRTWSRDTAHV